MKKTAIWVITMALSTAAGAQQNPVAVKYSKLITPEDARKQLSILASDEFEGRETGKPGADKAANYLADEFKKMGLLPANRGSYFLDVPLAQSDFKINKFNINGTPLVSGKDFYNANSSAIQTSVYANDIVFIGYGTPEELTTNVAGKIVLMIAEDKPLKDAGVQSATPAGRGSMSPARMKIIADLQEKGPSMILSARPENAAIAERYRARGASLYIKGAHEGYIRADPPTAVIFNITVDVADRILKSAGKTYAGLKQAIDEGTPQTQVVAANVDASYASVSKDVKAVDVVGCVPGSDPKLKDEVLVFSAHYDHIGLTTSGTDKVNNGADDDGSGTTGILEIARAFTQAQKDGHGPRRTVLFLGNVGEEKGLLGSEYYTDHPVFPIANTIADLNIDMIGRVGYEYQKKADSANYVYVIGSAMLSSALHKINEDANNSYTHLKLDYKYDDLNDKNQFYYRSDHYNFARYNVPIIFYFNGVHDDYHKPGDEVSKINFPLLVKRAQLVFFTGWDLANRDVRPAVDVKKASKNK